MNENEQDRKHRRTAGRVAFLALKDDIRKAIEAGWALSVVYDDFKDRLPIGYGQFRRYVRQFVTEPAPRRGATRASRSGPGSSPEAAWNAGSAVSPAIPAAPRRERRPGEPLIYDPTPAAELLGLTPKPASR